MSQKMKIMPVGILVAALAACGEDGGGSASNAAPKMQVQHPSILYLAFVNTWTGWAVGHGALPPRAA